MFFIVNISELKKKIIVPSKWIKDLNVDLVKIFNYGISYIKNKSFIVFVSENFDDEPNFNLESTAVFNIRRPSCYKANLLKCFGKGKISIYLNSIQKERCAKCENDLYPSLFYKYKTK